MESSNEFDFNLWAVLESIEWRDPLLIGIIIFHIAVTLMAFLTRNHNNFQVVLFLILLLLVYFSENLNKFATHHWRLLSRNQYFDSKGMFISLIFSVPILLNCMVMVASWLWQSSELMVQLKNAQLKQIKSKTSLDNKRNNTNNSEQASKSKEE